jgi:hypothetical protein
MNGAPESWRFERVLFRFVLFEEIAGFFQIENVSVYGELIFPCVFRDGDDTLDAVTVFPKGLDDKFDVYHASKFTAVEFPVGK